MKNHKILKLFLLSTIIVFNLFIGSVSAYGAAPDYFFVNGDDIANIDVKKYITNASPTLIQKYKVNTNGEIIYCLDINKYAVSKGKIVKYIKGKELDSRYVYILENGHPNKKITGDKEKDYFITNLAIWYTRKPERMTNFDLKTGKYTYNGVTKYSDSIVKMAELVNASKNYKQVMPSVSLSNGSMKIKNGQNFYESSYMTVKTTGNVSKYKVILENATENTIVTNKYGKVQNEFNKNEGFIIKVPTADVVDNKLSFSVKIEADGVINKAYLYSPENKPENAKVQDSVGLYPEHVSLNDSKKFDINVKTLVEISKVDATSQEELPGATLTVKDASGKVVEKFVSTNEPHVVKNLRPGKYTLTEEIAPEGYELSKETIEFEVKPDGSVTKVKMENKLKVVPIEISKQDIADKSELAGATLEIKDEKGNVVEKFVSTNEPHVIKNGLKPGKYTLTEIMAPEGYELSKETVEFTVNEDGTVDEKIVMYNKLKQEAVPIEISKQDITDKSELAGAHLEIKDEEGNVIIEFVSTDKPFIIKGGLKPGKYTLTETIAPDGYELSKETVKFTVNEDGTVDKKIIMFNKPETIIDVPATGTAKSITASIIGISIIGLGLYIIKNNVKKHEEM